MTAIDCIGLDIHQKTISFCAKAQDETILDQGKIPARREALLASEFSRKQGTSAAEAAVEGGRSRVRAILMTAAAMISACFPGRLDLERVEVKPLLLDEPS